MQHGEATILIHLLECKFGKISAKYREQINQANTKQLLAWTEQSLKIKLFQSYFQAWLKQHLVNSAVALQSGVLYGRFYDRYYSETSFKGYRFRFETLRV